MGTEVETSQAKQYRVSGNRENLGGDVPHKTSCIVTMVKRECNSESVIQSRQGHYNRCPLREEPADGIGINNLYYRATLHYLATRVTTSITQFPS
jgi:hypothetical protein